MQQKEREIIPEAGEKVPCPSCREAGNDTTGDNLVGLEEYAKCFACGYFVYREEKPIFRAALEREAYRDLQDRELSKKTCEKFGIKTAFYTGTFKGGKVSVEVEKVYVFETIENGKVINKKIRSKEHKDWQTQRGINTKTNRLFGQHAFEPNTKFNNPIIITEGEFDAAAIYEATGYAAVSITKGANKAKDQLAENLQWLNKWSYVVLAFDNDDAGQQAIRACLDILPPGKLRVCKFPLKDANDMLRAGRIQEMKTCIYNAESYKPSTIVTAEDVLYRIKRPEYGTPWPWEFMNRVTFGRRASEIYLLAGATGIGKTEILKDIVHSVLTNNETVGWFNFEQNAEDTYIRLASNHFKQRLYLPSNEWWNDKEIKDYIMSLNKKIYLYDHRTQITFENVLNDMYYLKHACGTNLIIIDNLKAMSSRPVINGRYVDVSTFQAYAVTQLREFAVKEKITLFIVSHLSDDKLTKQTYVSTSPKDPDTYFSQTAADINAKLNLPGMTWETGRMPSLENVFGQGTVRDLVNYAILIARNKESKDEIEQRTIKVKFAKARFVSDYDGEIYNLLYNRETGRLEEVL